MLLQDILIERGEHMRILVTNEAYNRLSVRVVQAKNEGLVGIRLDFEQPDASPLDYFVIPDMLMMAGRRISNLLFIDGGASQDVLTEDIRVFVGDTKFLTIFPLEYKSSHAWGADAHVHIPGGDPIVVSSAIIEHVTWDFVVASMIATPLVRLCMTEPIQLMEYLNRVQNGEVKDSIVSINNELHPVPESKIQPFMKQAEAFRGLLIRAKEQRPD